jgi:predicted membrane protein
MNEDKVNMEDEELYRKWTNEHRRGRLFSGLFVVAAGGLYLVRELGVTIPDWVFTWQMLLIAIGLVMGLKHSFKTFGWIILVLIGVAFMLKDFAPWFHFTNYFWPITIILVGLFMIFKPKRDYCEGHIKWRKYQQYRSENYTAGAQEDYLDFNAIFGGIRKNVITKTFRGGEVNAVFGGAEINMMQADFEGTIELEVNSIFGGTRLILPSNWTVKSEVAAVMGSVEDKRPLTKEQTADPNKILILRGNAIFGGIELQSFF